LSAGEGGAESEREDDPPHQPVTTGKPAARHCNGSALTIHGQEKVKPNEKFFTIKSYFISYLQK
jgi:hypothetical protein